MTGNTLQVFKRLQNDRFLNLLLMFVFVVTLVEFGVIAFLAGGVDFRGYYAAATLAVRGGNPYDYQQLAPVLNEITGYIGNNPYYYPPWFCLLFIPLTWFPFQVARAIWLALNLVIFYFSLENLQKSFLWPPKGWQCWGVYLLSSTLFALYCLRSEQAGILLLWGLSLVLLGIKTDKSFLIGLGLVIFATKPQATGFAILFLCVWLLFRNKKALIWASALTLGLTGLASIAIPRWWDFDKTGFGSGLSNALNGPGSADSIRVNATLYDFLKYQLGIEPVPWLIALIGIFFTAIIFWLLKTGEFDNPLFLAGVGALFTLLVTPYALQYDYVPLIALLFWVLFRVSRQSLQNKWIVAVTFLIIFLVLLLQKWSYTGYLIVLLVLFQLLVIVWTEKRIFMHETVMKL